MLQNLLLQPCQEIRSVGLAMKDRLLVLAASGEVREGARIFHAKLRAMKTEPRGREGQGQAMTPFLRSSSFLLLQQEGHLISSCLTTGLTQLRAANVHNKGAFYAALFNLSVGFERLLKATIIIDHMLKNNLSVPTRKQLKVYGHDILELYGSCVAISLAEPRKLSPLEALEANAREILLLFNEFAQTTRYHNLDALSSANSGKDPLVHWNEILLSILKSDVSSRSKAKIVSTASAVASAIADKTTTLMQGLDKQALSTEEALVLPGLHDQAVKHAVLYIVKLLSPVRYLISDLSHKAYTIGVSVPPFPQMQEFLEWLWDDRDFVLRKKKWP